MSSLLSNLSFPKISGNAVGDVLISESGGMGDLLGLFSGMAIVTVLISIALYIYLSLVYSKIGEKAKLGSPGIAWAPLGSLMIVFESAKKHWWPFLMLTLGGSLVYLVIMLAGFSSTIVSILAYVILIATLIIFSIMAIIWHWKTYEGIGRPGWWVLVPILSAILGVILSIVLGGLLEITALVFVGVGIILLGLIAHLILIGIAAWGESNPKSISEYGSPYAPEQENPEMGEEYGYA
jgi:hypothetical protein